MNPIAIVWSWLRVDLRRRGRSLAVLTLLIALAGGTVMASLAGARRGASAMQRLSDRTLPATAMVLPNQVGFDWSRVAKLPEVAALSQFIVDDLVTFEGINPESGGFPFVDDAFLQTIEKPVLLAGRVYNPARDDEAVVTNRFVVANHKGVGDTVYVDLPSAKQLASAADGTEPTKLTGPRIKLTIVGVIRAPWSLSFDLGGGPGGIQMSPGVVQRYPASTLGNQHNPGNPNYVNALVRLRGGAADLPRLRRDIARLTGRNDIEITDLVAQYRDVQHQIAFEARCLVAFGAAAFLAGLFLIGQAITRYAAASTAELQTMRALGMTPRQAIATASAGPVLGGVAGGVLGVIVAVVASYWTPIGSASDIEPTPGISFDWLVLGPGWLVVVLLVCVAAAAAAWLALSAARRGVVGRRSLAATTVARTGFPVPIVIGTRFASGVRAGAYLGARASGSGRGSDGGARGLGRLHLFPWGD